MKLVELKREVLNKLKGLPWSPWTSDGYVSPYNICEAVINLMPDSIKKYLTCGYNNKHMHISFSVRVANKNIEYTMFAITAKTKRDPDYGHTGYYLLADIEIDALTNYPDYTDQAEVDTVSFSEFILAMAKTEAEKNRSYEAMALKCIAEISEHVDSTDYINLYEAVNYIRNNFSNLYNKFINKD